MPKYITVPLALDLLLIAVEHVAPITKSFLPLGGDHLIQLGIPLSFGHFDRRIGENLQVESESLSYLQMFRSGRCAAP
jgi:hypothetical protein